MSTVLLLPKTKTLKHACVCLSLSFSESLIPLFLLQTTTPHEFVITGDFNLHLDHPDESQVKRLLFFIIYQIKK